MPLLPITAFYGALLGFILLYLAFKVVGFRQKHKVGLGHTNNDLVLAGRNHANASEYIPITLILLAFAELNGAANFVVHALGAVFVFARVIHAWGFQAGKGGIHVGRFWGTVLTFLSMVVLGLVNLYLGLPYLL